jgi:chromosomal replication initiator protein
MTEYTLSSAEVKAIWEQVCAELATQLSPAVFSAWILSNPLTDLKIDDQKAIAIITCPTAFHASNLKKNLSLQLTQALEKVIDKPVEFTIVIGSPPMESRDVPSQQAQPLPVVASAQPPVQPQYQSPPQSQPQPPTFQPQTQSPPPQYQRPAQNQSQNQGQHQMSSAAPSNSLFHRSSNTLKPNSPRVEDLFSPSTLQSVAMDRAIAISKGIGLRPDFTFETFAVSTTNEMAHAAASAVSQQPGVAYNPLFLYGGVGVGKTHLMHSIGNNILKRNPQTRIIYCTGEEFTNDIVNSIQTKKTLKFKEKYRTAQVLLLDDVQFIAGKNAVQEEFFHTFNALIKQSSQIVMTSDRPPHEINLLEDRLRSRFEAGLMIDIQQPSFELRTAILLIKAAAVNLIIPMDLAQLIASKVDSARKIEGIITKIRSAIELRKRQLDISLVEEILMTEIDQKKSPLRVSPTDVLRAVANHYHVKQAAIRGQQRVAQLVKARHVAMYLFKEDLNLPFTEIGKWFSNRDHTSALHAYRKIIEQMNQDELLQRDVSALRMSLTAVSGS